MPVPPGPSSWSHALEPVASSRSASQPRSNVPSWSYLSSNLPLSRPPGVRSSPNRSPCGAPRYPILATIKAAPAAAIPPVIVEDLESVALPRLLLFVFPPGFRLSCSFPTKRSRGTFRRTCWGRFRGEISLSLLYGSLRRTAVGRTLGDEIVAEHRVAAAAAGSTYACTACLSRTSTAASASARGFASSWVVEHGSFIAVVQCVSSVVAVRPPYADATTSAAADGCSLAAL